MYKIASRIIDSTPLDRYACTPSWIHVTPSRLHAASTSTLVQQAMLVLGDGDATLSPDKYTFVANVVSMLPIPAEMLQTKV